MLGKNLKKKNEQINSNGIGARAHDVFSSNKDTRNIGLLSTYFPCRLIRIERT